MRAVAAVLFLAVCAYLGAGLFGSRPRQRSAAVRPGSLYESVCLEGIVVRNEALLPASCPPPAEDGARVPAGRQLSQEGAQPVFVRQSALCFAGSDGYEALAAESLFPFSAERAQALLDYVPEKADSSRCRLVYDFCWYYAAVTEQPCSLEPGASVRLLFAGTERPVSAQIYAADESGGGTALLLRAGAMSPEYLCLRKCAAELILAEHSGLALPASAVHSDGSGAEYVYILTAGKKERREVEILYTHEGTSIVSLSDGAKALKEGDTVLV